MGAWVVGSDPIALQEKNVEGQLSDGQLCRYVRHALVCDMGRKDTGFSSLLSCEVDLEMFERRLKTC